MQLIRNPIHCCLSATTSAAFVVLIFYIPIDLLTALAPDRPEALSNLGAGR